MSALENIDYPGKPDIVIITYDNVGNHVKPFLDGGEQDTQV